MQRVEVVPHKYGEFQQARFPAIARTASRILLMVWESLPEGVCEEGMITNGRPPRSLERENSSDREKTFTPYCPSSLLMSRSFDNGETWEEPRPLMAGNPETHLGFHEPSFLLDRVTGRLFCFYTRTEAEPGRADTSRAAFFVARTDDNGETWKHEDITSMIIGGRDLKMAFVPRGRGTQLTAGKWAQRLCHGGVVVEPDGNRRAVFIGSDDQGVTWWSSQPVGSDVDYCSVVQNSDGTEVILMIKTCREATRVWAKSGDGGRTFSEPTGDIDSKLVNVLSPLEHVFYGAVPGSPHAEVITYVGERRHCSGECTVLMLSTNDAESFAPAVWFDAKTYGAVDVVSMPDLGQFAIAYEGPQGIMCETLPFSKLPIASLAKEWVGQA